MRIAHVIAGYDSDLLYQEGYLAREQARRGHDVVILARRVRGRAPGPVARVVPGRLPLLLVRLARSLRRERPDVVHVHSIHSQISVAACLLKPLLRYRLVVDSHSSSVNIRVDTLWRRLGLAAFRATVGRFIRHTADAVFAVGGPERDFTARLLGTPAEQIPVIPLGVDTDVFHPDPEDRVTARSRLGLHDDFVVLHAGRLVPGKGLDLLLAAAGRVGGTALLVGSLDERMRPVIESARASGVRVLLPGVLTKEELASALRAADVGVWMGVISISAVEAMAVGLPLVASRSQHFLELLGEDYPLVAGRLDDLADQLASLRDEPPLVAAIGSRNAERAAGLRSWSRIAEQVELTYT